MEIRLRTTRKMKVTEVKVTDQEMEHLAQLHDDARYESLLNVMERACIEIETAHLNTSIADPEAILGGHLMSKASWLFFQYIQKQVLHSYHARTLADEPVQEPTLEETFQGVEGLG